MSNLSSDSSVWLPLFPLPMVVLPGDLVPLHIFEERYRLLVGDCLTASEQGGEAIFGICLFHDEQVRTHGCIVSVDRVLQRYPDGRLDILTHGMRRFQVLRMREEKAYREAQVGVVEDAPAEAPDPAYVRRVEALCETYGGLVQAAGVAAGAMPDQPASFQFAGRVISDPLVRQRLLELSGEQNRLAYLEAFFEKAIPRLRKIEEINHRVKTNGHFKHLPGSEESLAD